MVFDGMLMVATDYIKAWTFYFTECWLRSGFHFWLKKYMVPKVQC